jgi:hypothetical protein
VVVVVISLPQAAQVRKLLGPAAQQATVFPAALVDKHGQAAEAEAQAVQGKVRAAFNIIKILVQEIYQAAMDRLHCRAGGLTDIRDRAATTKALLH